MEVTVVFRNMMPREALIALVKGLTDARAWAVRGTSARLQISIRRTYAVHLSSALCRQGWTAVDDDAERAVRAAFERFDQAAADGQRPVEVRGPARQSKLAAFARVGKALGVGKLAALSTRARSAEPSAR
jgi:hypothetical protein